MHIERRHLHVHINIELQAELQGLQVIYPQALDI